MFPGILVVVVCLLFLRIPGIWCFLIVGILRQRLHCKTFSFPASAQTNAGRVYSDVDTLVTVGITICYSTAGDAILLPSRSSCSLLPLHNM